MATKTLEIMQGLPATRYMTLNDVVAQTSTSRMSLRQFNRQKGDAISEGAGRFEN